MEIPSVLPLPAAASDRAGCLPYHPWGHMLLWTALLFLAPATTAGTPAQFPKAVVSLEPPWFNVLQEDNVTLNCLGTHSPGDRSTQWFHNGIIIPNRDQPSYSFKASLSDQGNYSCQTNQTNLSDPVYLNVTADWLLLQTPRLVFQEGEPIVLRCHRWRNQPLQRVIFFQDKKNKRLFHTYDVNSNFSIPQANTSHSGKYHCTGHGTKMLYTSRPVSITVRASSSSLLGDTFLVTVIVAVVAGIAAVAGVAVLVVWVCLKRNRSSANLTDTEEAAKVEAENTITYSLLQHPEAAEDETGHSDYKNA
ncbi:Fc receptor-like A isoform X4 [Saccopteryx leptura]|uniref:Fc receptor-like A isoform X4 n=1 Tax=Saccopteryx leptura TaxID=249018 RepID=UPI00339C26FA